ncbi:MAG: T9SS type A sorting domain-containing protein [Dysgonamonadaceae bacterium]|jgi:uncharacterized membrane protein|nr:T9SS type A sorting domain-containing protein [Dysgonamonadaceae bacterium]
MKRIASIFFLFFFFLFFSIRGQSFAIIEENNNRGVYPHGISSDGNYAVGQIGLGTATAGHHTFVWSVADGLTEWDTNPVDPAGLGSTGFAISNTGRVAGVAPDSSHLVDTYETPDDGLQYPLITAAFRDYDGQTWTVLPLPEGLSFFYGFGSRAHGISDDGHIIVGGQTQGGQAQRWTAGYWDAVDPANVIYHPLLTATGPGNSSVANAISGDGRVIGGQENGFPVIWIKDGSDYEKRHISGASGNPIAAVSNNGEYAVVQNNLRASLYRVATDTLIQIDFGSEYSTPLSVSDNGIVVGYHGSDGRPLSTDTRKAFIYSGVTGIVSLESFLESREIEVPLSSILAATGISADGRIITGFGVKNSKVVGFRVEIPEIPVDLLPIRNIGVNSPVYGTVILNWEAPEIPDDDAFSPPTAYHIYESDTLVEPLPAPQASQISRTYTGLAEGTYHYSIKAVYEKDGAAVEAIAGKTATVTISKKTILFYEPFTDYQTKGMQFDQKINLTEIPLSTGGWDVSANTVPFSATWRVNTSGRPPHSAGFVAPQSSSYDESLNSPFFDLRDPDIKDLFLAFEYGTSGSSDPEYLAVEIYDGETWYGIDTITPPASLTGEWNSRYYEVNEYAGKNNVRFRFRSFGTGSSGINWFVDNVEFADSAQRVFIQDALTVSARRAADGKVHVNWSDPFGNVTLRYMLDDNAYGALGNSQYPYIAANQYPAEDLSDYDGYYLTSISFWRTTNDTTHLAKQAQYRWFASQGEERLVFDTVIDPKIKWNTIQLANPIQIDATKPLYYGIEVTDADPNDWPVGSGGYYKGVEGETGIVPVFFDKIDGRGNLYSEDGGQTWRKISQDGEEFGNDLFCIRATLSKEIDASPLNARRILGYRIYRNNSTSLLEEEVGDDISISLNNFTDEQAPAGNVSYTVKTSFLDYREGPTLSAGRSASIEETGIKPVADANGWDVYPNPVKKNGIVHIEIHASGSAGNTIRIYDTVGRLVKEVPVAGLATPVAMDVASGVYVLKAGEAGALQVVVE